MAASRDNNWMNQRRAGVLLHPTSLPGSGRRGVLGRQAYHFVDWMAAAGLNVWQTLPLGPTHGDGSPYQCLSAYAGSPRMISLDLLYEQGYVNGPRPVDGEDDVEGQLLSIFEYWRTNHSQDEDAHFQNFCAHNAHWLPDYALFMALKRHHHSRSWGDWPKPLRDRESNALAEARHRFAHTIEYIAFEQFVFFKQWQALKRYANEKGILLYGDIPIFVAYDSADVWANRKRFLLDDNGQPIVVAGVPPDYFSATGQRWGNPLYHWETLEGEGFEWWLQRIRTQLDMVDILRIDHFRGFEAYWEIDADCATAVDGRWVKAPGEALFKALRKKLGKLPLVAEDLGVITPEVDKLREKFGLPGMKILQFAFGDNHRNPYLPHHHRYDFVVYTGTHDNDTTVGWFDSLDQGKRDHVLEYLGRPGEAMPWPMIRAAMESVAVMAIVPMQDFLGLNSQHRMNSPGTTQGNWGWRFQWDMIPADLAARIRQLTDLYGRSL